MKKSHPLTDIFKNKIKENKNNNIQSISLNLNQPIAMKSEIGIKDLNIIVGQNGAGKSLLLKIAGKSLLLKIQWAMALVAWIISHDFKNDLIQTAQFIFDHTFTENNFDGEIELNFDVGSIMMKFEKGKVIDAKIHELKPIGAPIYMSSDMRTFDNMVLYLNARKSQDLLKIYKLYDIMYEKLIAAFLKELSN